jgi:hypothetical protein
MCIPSDSIRGIAKWHDARVEARQTDRGVNRWPSETR